MSNPFAPISATTDEILGALRWAMQQASYAAYNLHNDRKISRHIAGQKSAELNAHRRALYEILKSVAASNAAAALADPDATG